MARDTGTDEKLIILESFNRYFKARVAREEIINVDFKGSTGCECEKCTKLKNHKDFKHKILVFNIKRI